MATSVRMSNAASSLAVAAALAGCAHAPPATEPAAGGTVVSGPVTYRCESGRTLQASYTSNTAEVRYEGKTLRMTVAMSASGARYVGDGMEWWTKGTGPGSTGTLSLQEPGGTTGEALEKCIQSG